VKGSLYSFRKSKIIDIFSPCNPEKISFILFDWYKRKLSDNAYGLGKKICEKLQKMIPRQLSPYLLKITIDDYITLKDYDGMLILIALMVLANSIGSLG